MEYKYEIHAHTKETSRCGGFSAKELVERYKAAGYDGIVITDHYSPMTFSPTEFFNKEKAIDHYLRGYREAKKQETEDFSVVLGMELRFYATVNDYLVYGISEEMLYRLPFLLPLYIKKASRILRNEGCLFLQAHPFREMIRRANRKYLDGVEVFNGKASAEANEKSLSWAREIGAKIQIAGSDCHRESSFGKAAILTEEKIKNNADLIRILKNGNYKLLKNTEITQPY